MSGPVLALDYGSRRIGMAVSDADAEFAFPAGTLVRHGLARDLEALREVIRERGVTRLVVGLPLHLNGRAGPEAAAARDFARALAGATGLPVELLDERWTTREAERALRAIEPRPSKRARERVDAAAAALLLQTWLARNRAEAGPRQGKPGGRAASASPKGAQRGEAERSGRPQGSRAEAGPRQGKPGGRAARRSRAEAGPRQAGPEGTSDR